MNRPFNGNNLVDDVAASFKKSLVVKALAALTEEAAIQVKLFGKVLAQADGSAPCRVLTQALTRAQAPGLPHLLAGKGQVVMTARPCRPAHL